MKICSTCKEEKTSEEFYKGFERKDGLASVCKSCMSAYCKKIYDKDPGKSAAFGRKWWLRKYGLSEEKFLAIRAEQGDSCKICKEKFLGTPDIDHCHKTGVVRGLLCNNCNRGIGFLKDSPSRLRMAAEYIELASVVVPYLNPYDDDCH